MKQLLHSVIIILACLCMGISAYAQTATISGTVSAKDARSLEDAIVAIKSTKYFTEVAPKGTYTLKAIPYGTYTVVAIALGKQPLEQRVIVNAPSIKLDLTLPNMADKELDAVRIYSEQEKALGIIRLRSVRDFTVYEGKKNEVVVLKNIAANTATNNTRQIYGSITGLNIWESDGAGLQLGVGGRGLSPNRTSNFNTRQNGYDISADALGYPESYYTPATEAVEQIEVIRGAASLQYGTQFGGMVNFRMKKGNLNTPFEYIGRQTYGSWNFINSFNSFSGATKNGKLSYYAFYQRKQGDGWRPNSKYEVNNAYAHLNYLLGSKTNIEAEYTHTDYIAQQPGGLTDAMFNQDPRQSVRARNWFKIDWNLFALNITHKFSARTQLNIRTFGLLAQRQALGNLDRINVVDFDQKRTLIDGQFKNVGSEIRLLHRYKMGKISNVLLVGSRLYAGHTTARQGDADALSGPNFSYLNPNDVEGSDYKFPNYNYALFAEHIFKVSDKLSITPGIRFENIQTYSQGYYRLRVFDFSGNLIADTRYKESLNRKRSFAIAGLGISYKAGRSAELYANISQNYRAINFSDMRIQNPNFVIDSNLADEKGYTADLGIRGDRMNILTYEVTAFYLHYNNRIGQILRATQPPLYLDYRMRTNVSESRNIGIEAYSSLNLARLFKGFSTNSDWTVFVNASVLDAKYIHSKDASIEGNMVEMVPPVIIRSGTTYKQSKWKVGFQVNYTAKQFSDATNSPYASSGIEGLIPAYTVADISAAYNINKWLTAEASCNNLFNKMYFTRRAESYPGPGIIPSDGRSLFLTLQVKLSAKQYR